MLRRAYLSPEILPEHLRQNDQFLESFSTLLLAKFMTEFVGYAQDQSDDQSTLAFLTSRKRKFVKFLNDYDLLQTPVDASPELIGEPGGVTVASPDAGKDVDVAITLTSLNLVDLRNTSLEDILKFRQRSGTLERMHDFRAWTGDLFTGKSKDDIERGITKAREVYERKRRELRVSAADASLTVLRSSKDLAGTYLGTELAKLAGHTDWAHLLPAAGITLVLADIAVRIMQHRNKIRDLVRENPVSYISYAEKHLVNSQ